MKGIQVAKYVKSVDELVVTDLPEPEPAPDQYLIAVHAAAANFFDILQVQGKYQTQPPFPWTAGFEFAGVVLATPRQLAPGQTRPRFSVGDRVFGAGQGAYATRACTTESQLQPIPAGWSFAEASGLFVTAPTSYAALVRRANIRAGDYVLVHAAAGGVGLAAVQIAKAFGATVIATAGTAEKLKIAQSFGADHVIDYTVTTPSTRKGKDGKPLPPQPAWPDEVRKLTPQGRGVDIVYDSVGLVDRSTRCTAWNGRIVVVGFAAGQIEQVAMNKVLLKNISLVGVHWGAYSLNEPDAIPVVWDGLHRLIDRGAFRPTVFTGSSQTRASPSRQIFSGLERVPAALKALGGRATWGKVVVDVPQEAESKL